LRQRGVAFIFTGRHLRVNMAGQRRAHRGDSMGRFANLADMKAIEAETPWPPVGAPRSMYEFLSMTRASHGMRPAISFQILSGPKDKAVTMTWNDLHGRVTQAANLFHSLGVGPDDVVAYILPNCLEAAVTLIAGAVVGIVNPVNPLLEAEQISAILRETGAKVVVTLKAFPKTDLPQKVAEAVRHAPTVRTVLEVDLASYLTPPKSWIVSLIRPKNPAQHVANVMDFNAECARQPASRLTFEDVTEDRVTAYFHTGGTTGMPKVAQHRFSGMYYNGWLGAHLLFRETDVVLCPLPLFHVFAAYPILMSMLASGAHVVFPTPAGYRGEGVMDNLWKLIERWQITYLITVPTALAALMQRPVDADISCLRNAFSGSAALPVELYHRFKKATGIDIVEGYGLTECTCLVSINPPEGTKKIGSVGLPFPHTQLRILRTDGTGGFRDCAIDEVGEICVFNPGVFVGATYTEVEKNRDLFAEGVFLRTGDLGRIDADGYLFITGRAKDLIIRGGHNIDPAAIEEALMALEGVAMVGAIGQPDLRSGELPCAYVELVKGAAFGVDDLMAFAQSHIHERAAVPKYIEIVTELPKTAVGKVFKPELRRMAIHRVFDAALAEAGLGVHVEAVVEDRKRGSVARLHRTAPVEDSAVIAVLGGFTVSWEWAT
jgi:fatty-acyl-CoA synthase